MFGCSPEMPEQYLVIDGRQGEYGLTEAPIPELDDPVRMQGALGDGTVGGFIDGRLDNLALVDATYAGGGPIRLDYRVQDGVGVPFDEDGLVLWSYYRALSSFRSDLDARGVTTDDVFPVPFAYQPSIGGAVLSSNAAYVADEVHLFVLLPDGGGDGLPLAANPGVIRHEFGHALFQSIIGGGVGVSTPPIALPEVAALNEGFADMVASISLDDPDFIAASIDLDGTRDVSGDHTLDGTELPEVDPYSRGTVYASFAWDVRRLTDDPDFALVAVIRALEDWAATEAWNDGQAGIDRYPQFLADRVLADRPGIEAALCDAHTTRFPGIARPGSCP